MPVKTEKSKEAEATLPDELRPVYRRLVEEYEFLTTVQYGRGYAAYKVLAELILAGWRPAADALPTSSLGKPA